MKTRQLFVFLLAAFCFTACAGKSDQLKAPVGKISEPVKVEKPVSEKPAPEKPSQRPAKPEKIKSGADKLIVIGEAEYITIKPDNIRLTARIDTGATTSSIHATEIKQFERDGKKWVHFNLIQKSGEKVEFKRRLLRTIEVKRHGMDQQSRPVISLQTTMGPIVKSSQFSLTDRSQFKFPVLIGRSFLKGTALVDVNRDYILSPLSGGNNEN